MRQRKSECRRKRDRRLHQKERERHNEGDTLLHVGARGGAAAAATGREKGGNAAATAKHTVAWRKIGEKPRISVINTRAEGPPESAPK